MRYETPTIEVIGKASELIQGHLIPGTDGGVSSQQGADYSSQLEEN